MAQASAPKSGEGGKQGVRRKWTKPEEDTIKSAATTKKQVTVEGNTSSTQRLPIGVQNSKIRIMGGMQERISNLERHNIRNSSIFSGSTTGFGGNKKFSLTNKCSLRSHMDSVKGLQFI
jgi:hypothetical protein